MKSLEQIGIKDNLAKNISQLIKHNRLAHAILIDAGSAKQRDELAVFLAESFVCSEENHPCGKCHNCLKAESLCHPDIIIKDPDEINEKTFKVSAVREIRTDAYIIPNEADKKVYILKSADKMNPQAQNALLKIIEEPPEYARFILECESRASMLDTIMSRVTAFGLGADNSANESNEISCADELAIKLAQALLDSTEIEFMKLCSAFEKDKELFSSVLPSFQLIFRNAVIINSGSTLTLGAGNEVSRMLASKFSVNALMAIIKQTDEFNLSISRNANKNLLITRFCSVMRNTAYNI